MASVCRATDAPVRTDHASQAPLCPASRWEVWGPGDEVLLHWKLQRWLPKVRVLKTAKGRVKKGCPADIAPAALAAHGAAAEMGDAVASGRNHPADHRAAQPNSGSLGSPVMIGMISPTDADDLAFQQPTDFGLGHGDSARRHLPRGRDGDMDMLRLAQWNSAQLHMQRQENVGVNQGESLPLPSSTPNESCDSDGDEEDSGSEADDCAPLRLNRFDRI